MALNIVESLKFVDKNHLSYGMLFAIFLIFGIWPQWSKGKPQRIMPIESLVRAMEVMEAMTVSTWTFQSDVHDIF